MKHYASIGIAILVFSIGLHGACTKAAPNEPLQRQQAELYRIGRGLYDAIMQEDREAFARLIFPTQREYNFIEIGEDNAIQYDEFEQSMHTQTDAAYARIFSTPLLRQLFGSGERGILGRGVFTAKNILSVRDHFHNAGAALAIHVTIQPGSPGVPTYGTVHYDWPGKETTEFVDPVFVYTRFGWQMYTYFGH